MLCHMLCSAMPCYAVPHCTTDSMLDHLTLCCAEPFAMLCHTTTPPLQCTILYEFMPLCAMLPHVMLRHVMLCCAVSGHAVQLQCVMLFSAMLCYAMLCCAMPYCAMLCHGVCRVPWGEALLSLEAAREKHDPTNGQVLTRGLSARVGIFHGPITRLCPHAVTGELLPIPTCCSICFLVVSSRLFCL